MSKAEVEEHRLSKYVVMSDELEISFKTWWRHLDPSVTVDVRFPHARHGKSGTNSAKTKIMDDFT